MSHNRYVVVFVTMVCTSYIWPLQDRRSEEPRLSAPTFYIAGRVSDCYPKQLQVKGVSNLPTGSILDISIGRPFGDFGFDRYSEIVKTPVQRDGSFAAQLSPKNGYSFRHNLFVNIFFGPPYAEQPEQVRRVVGQRGEKLDELRNPQVGKASGNNFVLATEVRVGFCGSSD